MYNLQSTLADIMVVDMLQDLPADLALRLQATLLEMRVDILDATATPTKFVATVEFNDPSPADLGLHLDYSIFHS